MALKILVVDDEITIRDSLKIVLDEEGYTTATAAHGAEALEMAKEDHFDIIITDLKMPEMDGMTLLQKCRQTCPQTSIIIITAHGSLDSASEALRLGA